jgi:hypothetical protein
MQDKIGEGRDLKLKIHLEHREAIQKSLTYVKEVSIVTAKRSD